jgi:cytochrome c oxidase subunit 4
LTGLLVGLSVTHRPNLALLGLLVITPTKACLVLFYFMHLKYESAALKYMVAAAIAVLIIFIGLTFSDYCSGRQRCLAALPAFRTKSTRSFSTLPR